LKQFETTNGSALFTWISWGSDNRRSRTPHRADKPKVATRLVFGKMAKNTSSSAFRKIDIDAYNEDNYKEDEQGELQSPPVGPDEAEVNAYLNQWV
jgi:ARP2/3 complex 16 kDa subunit (p16-Arc)